MTIRKAGKLVRLVDSALETAKRTQIKLMEAQIETPKESHELAQDLIACVRDQTVLVERLTRTQEALEELQQQLQAALDAEKE